MKTSMRPIACSTTNAIIGLKSSPPAGGIILRKILRYGSVIWHKYRATTESCPYCLA